MLKALDIVIQYRVKGSVDVDSFKYSPPNLSIYQAGLSTLWFKEISFQIILPEDRNCKDISLSIYSLSFEQRKDGREGFLINSFSLFYVFLVTQN